MSMENWLGMRQQIQDGALSLPLSPGTRLQMIAVDDIGGPVALAFERPGKWQDRAFELAGDELSMSELAQVFTRVAGHPGTKWPRFADRSRGPGAAERENRCRIPTRFFRSQSDRRAAAESRPAGALPRVGVCIGTRPDLGIGTSGIPFDPEKCRPA